MSMKIEDEDIGKRINSLLAQLQHESAILDKIVYKGKNQHRRAFYFQYLLKVRRDVKLLQSANLKEILDFIFQYTNKEKSNSSVKRRKFNNQKHHFQMRLLGVARLLSQMVEPMVKAAIEFSSLLARSFFMGFSLTNMALLARLRVLVQQILLDLVSLFNTLSSNAVKIGGIEVIALECVWETDKFVLVEKTSKPEDRNLVKCDPDGFEPSNIKYQAITAFLGDLDDEGDDVLSPSEDISHHGSPSEAKSGSSFEVKEVELEADLKRKVAFVSVVSRDRKDKEISVDCGGKGLEEKKEDSFFSLLAAGQVKDTLF